MSQTLSNIVTYHEAKTQWPPLPVRDAYTIREVAEALNQSLGINIQAAFKSIYMHIEAGNIRAYRYMPSRRRGGGAVVRWYIPRNQLPGIYEGWRV